MAEPTGGPPVARGDAFIVPKAPRSKRRGNPQTRRTRDMDKVRRIKEQADKEAAEAEKLHGGFWTATAAGVGPCVMSHHEDVSTQMFVYSICRSDARLDRVFSANVRYPFATLNSMVSKKGIDQASEIILNELHQRDREMLVSINRARLEAELPTVRYSMQRWQDALVLANPPTSQATKKGGNIPVTQEMIEDNRVAAFQSTLTAMNRGYISKDEAKKRLQNITDA